MSLDDGVSDALAGAAGRAAADVNESRSGGSEILFLLFRGALSARFL